MKKVIFFDLDNTLYSYDHCAELADEAIENFCARQFGIPREETAAEVPAVMNRIIEEMGPEQAATHDRLLRFKRFLQDHSLPIFPYAGIMYDLYWDTLIGAAKPEPGAWELLMELRRQGWYIACATNMTSLIQYRKIRKLGMGSLLDDLLTSEEACTEKPFPAFFRFCAERVGVPPEACVFVGDNFRLDVLGSEAAGMHGIHYQTPDLALRHRKADPGYPVIRDYRDTEDCIRIIEAAAAHRRGRLGSE